MRDFFGRLYDAALNLFTVGLVVVLVVMAYTIITNISPVATVSAADETWSPEQMAQADLILARRQVAAWEEAGRAWADADWPKVVQALEEIDPANPFVGEKIFAAHFNYGVQLRQKGLLSEAKAEFNAAVLLAGNDKSRKDLATAAVAEVDKLLRQSSVVPTAKEAAKGPLYMVNIPFYAEGDVVNYKDEVVPVLFTIGPSRTKISAPKMRTAVQILGGMQGPAKWNLIDPKRDTWRASASRGIMAGTFLQLETNSREELLLTNIQTGEQWYVSNPVHVAGGDFWWDGRNWWTTTWPSGFF